jgi:hypothetical protein
MTVRMGPSPLSAADQNLVLVGSECLDLRLVPTFRAVCCLSNRSAAANFSLCSP